eukprot:CAMPEP_0175603320 /NCGR_PEP_ID=MMETSP0096-20121207/59090_1 /TAXON_ID=311494 /ORGANISM="Alexandrium monilatum, Strain CCMP3105" /LENGTH=47 /DNA_ID= /DNA_START= /DNA_END= /DNA_ORIENTATION=
MSSLKIRICWSRPSVDAAADVPMDPCGAGVVGAAAAEEPGLPACAAP